MPRNRTRLAHQTWEAWSRQTQSPHCTVWQSPRYCQGLLSHKETKPSSPPRILSSTARLRSASGFHPSPSCWSGYTAKCHGRPCLLRRCNGYHWWLPALCPIPCLTEEEPGSLSSGPESHDPAAPERNFLFQKYSRSGGLPPSPADTSPAPGISAPPPPGRR